MIALRAGVLNGAIDCIASHHLPQNWDNKTCEFEYAKNGMTGLETALAVVLTVIPQLSSDQLIKLFSLNARNIFNLTVTNIQEGALAELSLYSRSQSTILEKNQIKSKSFNTPFLQKPLQAKVLGIVNKGKIILN